MTLQTRPDTQDSEPDALSTNRFLLAYRGHGRQWKDAQLPDVLHHLGEGHSFAKSCELAGIPRRTAYNLISQEPAFAEAVAHVKRNHGADWYEDAVRGIITGEVKAGATGAIAIGLKLRGRLLDTAKATTDNDQRVLIEQVVNTAQGTIRQRFQVQRGGGSGYLENVAPPHNELT